MTLDDFIAKYKGKSVEVAGSVGAEYQCVDLVNLYIRDVLGLPIIEWTDAKDFPTRAGDKYEYIVNTPEGVPQKGDIIVWNGNVGGGHGHIAIFIEGDANSFTSFDQNYSIIHVCTIEAHSYLYVDGWLRPKGIENETLQAQYDQCRVDRDNHWNDLQAKIKEFGGLNTKYNLLLGEKVNIDKQLTESLKNYAILQDTSNTTIESTNYQLKEQSAKIQDLESQVLTLTTSLHESGDEKQKQINKLTLEKEGLEKRVSELQKEVNTTIQYEIAFRAGKWAVVKFI